jgi:guanosine-3',5'-bis(diphosphate) 3'-pyrophosphohydrolase
MSLATILKRPNSSIRESVLDGLPKNPHKLFDYLCEELLSSYLDESELKLVRSAYELAYSAHQGQKRHSGEHYIIHPIHVALTLAELRLDENCICAAILHDVVEDTPISVGDLSIKFGEDIAKLVDGVSKIEKLDFYSREQVEAENIRKMLMAMSQDIRVMIIKLADRLHNMRTLGSLKPEKQRRISLQTLEIFAPIANRLGLYHWNTELQELCFKYIYPKRYRALTGAVKVRDGNRKAKVRKMRADIQAAIDSANIYAQVAGRRKNVYSIYKKNGA